MFLSNDYTFLLVLSQDGLPRSMSVVPNKRPLKWLNLVLDLNGILCVTGSASAILRGSWKCSLRNQKNFSSTALAMIGSKAVYIRSGLRDFLVEMRKFVNSVVIWSSMKESTAEAIAAFLFGGLPPPDVILG